MFYFYIVLFFIITPFSSGFASYTKPAEFDENIWNSLKPYLLPKNHPIRPALDKIFRASRVTLNVDTLKAAGFLQPFPGPNSHAIVTRHPALKGYLLKLYTDDRVDKVDWFELLKRIKGANQIKAAITRHKFESLFKVPKKWLYQLPESPSDNPSADRKHFVLVVEDMNILSYRRNRKQWTSAAMTPRRVRALYTLISELGLDDSVYFFNVPFSKDGKQAFIDTPRYHIWPIKFEILENFINHKMRWYWRELVKHNGKAPKVPKH